MSSDADRELLPQHKRLVEDSAIAPDVAVERGYRSITTIVELERLGFGKKQRRVPALLVPIHDVHGELSLYQSRPDEPRIDHRGRAIKYETPGGARMILDVPPRVRSYLGDPGIPLFVTEGARKADAAVSRDVACIALLGVWNWRGTNGLGGKVSLPDWESVALNGREVYIAFDSDATMKSGVQDALRRLAGFLERRGAHVRIIHLPCNDGGVKVGLDDYLAAGHGIEDLIALAKDNLEAVDERSRRDSYPYEESDGGLIRHKETKDGPVPVQLTNFTARIISDIERDDGVEVIRALNIEAGLDGRQSRFTVPAVKFTGMNWPMEHLGAEAVIYPGHTSRDHTRVAIQLLSGSVPKQRVYTHTGWRIVDGVSCYLHGGGAIGPEGLLGGIRVDLPSALGSFVLDEPPTGQELQQAVAATLMFLNVAPGRVSVPIVAAIFRSVLGTTDVSVHLTGPTGGGKSELASRAMQHFGQHFDRTHLPASWSSTGNALETLAFIAKDALLVVDDFCPAGSLSDIQRLNREADRLMRAQGNLSGRGRLAADGSLRLVRPPRGLTLSTGEDVPRGQSLRARLLIIEVGPDDVDFDVLTHAQKAGADGLYAAAMAGFLRWLAPRYDDLRRTMAAEIAKTRVGVPRDGQHRRTPGIIADLYFGLQTFLSFAQDVGAIPSRVAVDLLAQAWVALGEAASEQGEHLRAAEPTSRFLELLRSALGCGDAHVATMDGVAPDNAGAWGWRERIVGTGLNARTEWQDEGRRVGWMDDHGLYLDRDAAYRVGQAVAGSNGDGLAVSARTLVKRLSERGLLASTESSRKSLQVRRMIEGTRRNVVHLRPDVLYPSHGIVEEDIAE